MLPDSCPPTVSTPHQPSPTRQWQWLLLPLLFGGVSLQRPSLALEPSNDVLLADVDNSSLFDQSAEADFPEVNLFEQPEHAACFIDPATGEAVAEARDVRWLELAPSEVLAVLQETFASSGMTFNELDAFCGEQYFAALTGTGESFMTFSLVALKDWTLFVVWETPPQ